MRSSVSVRSYTCCVEHTQAGFCFVLAVSCAKDFYEDYQRLKADHGGNAQPVEVLRDGAFVRIPAWHLLGMRIL